MAMEQDTIELPAAWCSALINGDYSSFDHSAEDENEAARCAAVEADLAKDGWSIVDCADEARFTWSYQLYDHGASCSGGDVLEYTILRAVADVKL